MIKRSLYVVLLGSSLAACAGGGGSPSAEPKSDIEVIGKTNPISTPAPAIPPVPDNGEGTDGGNPETPGTTVPSPPIPQFTFRNGTTITNEAVGTPAAFRDYYREAACERLRWGNPAQCANIERYTLPGYIDNIVDQKYDSVAIPGLREAHNEGWYGNGVNLGIVEVSPLGLHGSRVTAIAEHVAPGANFSNYYLRDVNTHGGRYFTGINQNHDVVNHSYGQLPQIDNEGRPYAMNANLYRNLIEVQGPNAVHVYAAGNWGNVTHGQRLDDTHRADTSNCVQAGDHWTSDSCTGIRAIYDEGVDVSRVIFVGALGDTVSGGRVLFEGNQEELAWYSNSAGTRAMNDFIVANGENSAQHANGTGTSYAAPRVSGAAALVIHKFDTNAVNTKQILLQTADDLGAPGVDPVFGHGRLNVGSALSPVGNLR